MDRWSFLALLLILSGCQNLEIKEMKVPDLVELGNEAEFLCSFDLGRHKNATWLEMHWYFQPEGDRKRRIFQWLLGSKPQLFEKEDSIDLTCSSEDMNLKKDDCGFRLIEPGPNYSGNYTCTVSTFDSEKRKTLPMVVYTNIVKPEIYVDSTADGTSAPATSWFVCNATGVHPEPDLKLFIDGKVVTSEEKAPSKRDAAGFYNPSSRVALDEIADSVQLSCQLVYPSLPDIAPKTAYYTHYEVAPPPPELILKGVTAAPDADTTPLPKSVAPPPPADEKGASAAPDADTTPLPKSVPDAAQTSIGSLFLVTLTALLLL